MAVAAFSFLLLAGCGSSAKKATPLPIRPMPTSSAVDPGEAARQAATAAYTAMWTDMSKAGETADWQSPALATHASDAALSGMKDLLKRDSQVGAVLLGGPPTMHPVVTSMLPAASPTVVTLKDCVGTQHWLLHHKSTGALWDDVPGGNRATTAEVVESAGAWKVVGFSVAGLGTC